MKTLPRTVIFLCQLMLIFGMSTTLSCSSDDGSMDPPLENPDGNGNGDGSGDGSGDGDGTTEPTAIIRINAGGQGYVYDDATFVEDQYFSTGTETYANLQIQDILNTVKDSLYITERYSNNAEGTFSYDIPITDGTYTVTLHFAEIYFDAEGGMAGGQGSRVFDVSMEDQLVLDDYDILAETNAETALIKTFEVVVADQELNIRFTAVTDNAKISAIEIFGDGQLLP